MNPQFPESSPETKGVVGLQNMGNTCYANSALQLLRACSEWTVYCISNEVLDDGAPETSSRKVLRAYRDVLQSLWSSHLPAYVRPAAFLHEIRQAVQGTPYDMFGLPIPNDSHEYLVYLLDQFHEALAEKQAAYVIPCPDHATEESAMRIRAMNGWNRFCSTQGVSPLVRLFFGMIRKTIECSHCHTRTYQWEVFNSLKVPCIAGAPFHEWIRREANDATVLEGYQCDTCKARRTAQLQSHLWKLPQHLFMTLHRFQGDGQKDMTPCPYDGVDLSFESYYAPETDDPMKRLTYELRGVSDHHGTHLGGHYTAQCKHPITGQWWWYDDERAMPMPHPQCNAANYIFYFRCRPDSSSY